MGVLPMLVMPHYVKNPMTQTPVVEPKSIPPAGLNVGLFDELRQLTPGTPLVADPTADEHGQRTLMHFAGTFAGFPANLSMDSMAENNFVSAKWVKRAQLHVTPCVKVVTLGDGSNVSADGTCTVTLTVDGSCLGSVKCLVMSLDDSYDVLLGNPWLRSKHAVLDFGTGACTLKKGRHPPVTLRCKTLAGRHAPATHPADGHGRQACIGNS